jgi:hypothetical protein
MMKKKIVAIAILILIISPLTISKETESGKNLSPKKVTNFLNSINQDDFYGDISESELFMKFKELAGNESNIGFCGPAFINSSGKGLHAGRNVKFLVLEIPIGIGGTFLDFMRFPRYLWGMWLYFIVYLNESAWTKIYPLKNGLKIDENNSINITGKHIVLNGLFIFREPFRTRKGLFKPIISLLTGIPKANITFPIEKFHGKQFFIYNKRPYNWLTILQFFSPIKVKIPFYGFFISLDYHGYTPFAMWINT